MCTPWALDVGSVKTLATRRTCSMPQHRLCLVCRGPQMPPAWPYGRAVPALLISLDVSRSSEIKWTLVKLKSTGVKARGVQEIPRARGPPCDQNSPPIARPAFTILTGSASVDGHRCQSGTPHYPTTPRPEWLKLGQTQAGRCHGHWEPYGQGPQGLQGEQGTEVHCVHHSVDPHPTACP